MLKIGLLVLSNTKNRKWNKIEETYLYNISIPSFLETYCKSYNYTIYIGINSNDILLTKNKNIINSFVNNIDNVNIEFIEFNNIEPGYVTKMWNVLFNKAYNDNCDYFFQMGDDIQFLDKYWVTESIETLKKNNNIGITGPISENVCPHLLTQTFVSRKHMEIFGFYFPEEIKNWHCDDWINEIYKITNEKYLFLLKNYKLSNICICRDKKKNMRYKIYKLDYKSIIKKYQPVLLKFISFL
jgi:hypothetical protein